MCFGTSCDPDVQKNGFSVDATLVSKSFKLLDYSRRCLMLDLSGKAANSSRAALCSTGLPHSQVRAIVQCHHHVTGDRKKQK